MACRTTAIVDRPITVDPGLSESDVEIAIVALLGDRPDPDQFGDPLLAAFVWQDRDPTVWKYERRQPGRVSINYSSGRHRLLVDIFYDKNSARIEIYQSMNLRQSSTRIHKAAYRWIGELESALAGSLAMLRDNKKKVFAASLDVLVREGAREHDALLRAVCARAKNAGPNSNQAALFRAAVDRMEPAPAQLVDPIASVLPGHADQILQAWFSGALSSLNGRRRGASPDTLRDVFAYVKWKGAESPEYARLRDSLAELNLNYEELGHVVASVFSDYAAQQMSELELNVRLDTSGDRLLRDDLENRLERALPAVRLRSEGEPVEVRLVIERLKWNAREAPPRSQTITYSRGQVSFLGALLLMPDYSTYQFEHTTGDASIDYAFAIRAEGQDGQVIYDRVIRNVVTEDYSSCTNMRIRNAFGGVQPADFIANDHMRSLCSDNSAPIRVRELESAALSYLVTKIATIPEIMQANSRY
jgi:hypothetical protein